LSTWQPQNSGDRVVCTELLSARKDNCQVASVVKSTDFKVEQHLASVWGCAVNVHSHMNITMAESADMVPPSLFLQKQLADQDRTQPGNVTLDHIKQKLGGQGPTSTVDVLNVDCDGCEYELLCGSAAAQQFVRDNVGQLLLRTLWSSTTSLLWKCLAEDIGLVPFHRETVAMADGGVVAEFSLINSKLTQRIETI